MWDITKGWLLFAAIPPIYGKWPDNNGDRMKCKKVSYHRVVPGNGGSAAAEPESFMWDVMYCLVFWMVTVTTHLQVKALCLCGRWFYG